MFGMIHKSARDMVLEHFGAEAWKQVLATAELDDSALVSAQSYPDEMTFRLINAAAETAGLSLEETLHAFGLHWIKASEHGPYANVLQILGASLLESLMNLDSMHASIQIAMPDAQLPQFTVVEHDEASIQVSYSSCRKGLEPFVGGLLEGLMAKFSTEGTVTQSTAIDETSLFTIALAA